MFTKVYVAGSYSGDDVITILNNMRIGMRACTELLLENFAPFCPWLDFHFQLMLRDGEDIDVDKYYAYSIAWLEASDVVYVLPNSEKSKGVQEEIGRATDLGIPVVHDRKELKEKWLGYSREDKTKKDLADALSMIERIKTVMPNLEKAMDSWHKTIALVPNVFSKVVVVEEASVSLTTKGTKDNG